jgi:hypothetical protein
MSLFACYGRQEFWSFPYSMPFLDKLRIIHLFPYSFLLWQLCGIFMGAKWFVFVIEVCGRKKGVVWT